MSGIKLVIFNVFLPIKYCKNFSSHIFENDETPGYHQQKFICPLGPHDNNSLEDIQTKKCVNKKAMRFVSPIEWNIISIGYSRKKQAMTGCCLHRILTWRKTRCWASDFMSISLSMENAWLCPSSPSWSSGPKVIFLLIVRIIEKHDKPCLLKLFRLIPWLRLCICPKSWRNLVLPKHTKLLRILWKKTNSHYSDSCWACSIDWRRWWSMTERSFCWPMITPPLFSRRELAKAFCFTADIDLLSLDLKPFIHYI